MTLLIVDDDRDQLAVRELLLAREGFKTVSAVDAPSALRAAASAHPSCAVVDLRLPDEQSGLRLIRDLKKLDEKLRIFVLTGGDPDRIRKAAESQWIEEIWEKGSPAIGFIRKLKSIQTEVSKSPARTLRRLRSQDPEC